MTTPRFAEDEIKSRAEKLADEQEPGWAAILSAERGGQDTVELRSWQERALREPEAE